MRYSIYHFFMQLINKRDHFRRVIRLDDFPFSEAMFSCKNRGIWPDLAIRLNKSDPLFTGGELIELKDAKNFIISSFNSTIPLGRKSIDSLYKSNTIRRQMEEAGDDILSLAIRDVYYLVRGRKGTNVKVCLTHGKFFETISEPDLVRGAFSQMLDERIKETGVQFPNRVREKLVSIFDKRDIFAQSRKVDKASVKLRFRIMTEISPEGNVLIYPDIAENSISLLVPYENDGQRNNSINLMKTALIDVQQKQISDQMSILDIHHRLNGPFICFQIAL